MCNHFSAATIDGTCMTCERENASPFGSGPLACYAGGREGWRTGPTVAEVERENREQFKDVKGGVEYVGSHRKQSLAVNRHFEKP